MSFGFFLAFPFCFPCDGFSHRSFIEFFIIELFDSNNLLLGQCFFFFNFVISQIGHHLIKYLAKFGYKLDMKGFFNKKGSFYILDYLLESITKIWQYGILFFPKKTEVNLGHLFL